MNSKTLFVALIANLVSGFSLNNPVKGTEWKAGTQTTITWIVDSADSADAKATLVLKSGDPNNLQNVATIGSAPLSAGKITFDVPSTVVDGKDYAVSISTNDKDVKYSHFFSISGGPQASVKPTPTTITAAPSSSETATAGKKTTKDSDDESTTKKEDSSSTETSKDQSSTATDSSSQTKSTAKSASSTTTSTSDSRQSLAISFSLLTAVTSLLFLQ